MAYLTRYGATNIARLARALGEPVGVVKESLGKLRAKGLCVNKSVVPMMHVTNRDGMAIPIEPAEWMNIDASTALDSLSGMKPRQATDKLRRLDSTRADREIAVLKEQFRREDLAELAQGRGAELTARNRRLLGIREGAKGKLVGFNGVRFE